MPDITLTIGGASHTHTISAGNSTRLINALATHYGTSATSAALCPAISRSLFNQLKSQVQNVERQAAIADIPATES